jgi:hypothetical protein
MNNPIVNLLFIATCLMASGIFITACDEAEAGADAGYEQVDVGYSDVCDACDVYDDTGRPDVRSEDVEPELSERERDEVRVEITKDNADIASDYVEITAYGVVFDILEEE